MSKPLLTKLDIILDGIKIALFLNFCIKILYFLKMKKENKKM